MIMSSLGWRLHAKVADFVMFVVKLKFMATKQLSPYCNTQLAIPRLRRELGRVYNFKQLIIWHHMIGYLTKLNAFRMNRDEVMDLETWFKIHTNVSYFEPASPKTI